jgi:competence protein ComEC
MPAGLAALALMPVGLERLALVPMGWGIQAILFIGRSVSSWPAATLPVTHMPAWGLALVALGMAWLGIWRRRVRLAGLAVLAAGLLSPLLANPPDLLVSPDARLIAMRAGRAAYAQANAGAARFTEESWAQYWAVRKLGTLAEAGPDMASCTTATCLLRPRADRPAALLLRQGAPDRCGDAAVVLSAEPAAGRCAGQAVPVIDRFTVWRDGAHAVWLEPGGARILSDRAERGRRPWVSLPPEERAATNLPPALREPLPPK